MGREEGVSSSPFRRTAEITRGEEGRAEDKSYLGRIWGFSGYHLGAGVGCCYAAEDTILEVATLTPDARAVEISSQRIAGQGIDKVVGGSLYGGDTLLPACAVIAKDSNGRPSIVIDHRMGGVWYAARLARGGSRSRPNAIRRLAAKNCKANNQKRVCAGRDNLNFRVFSAS